ncbi:MAG: Hsp33 family molecular chaperone HslO, partial [Firmicutes bacterium]|nr:Hsp33 family molecular chaperone HslO [Bacillota bacterium]
GSEALRDMIAEGKSIEVSCQFCEQTYLFSPDELSALLRETEA